MAVAKEGKKKAPKASKKTHVCLTFWGYRFQDGHKTRLRKIGELENRSDGSWALRVERDKEQRARELLAHWTATGVIGSTKHKPEPQPVRRRKSELPALARFDIAADGPEMSEADLLRLLGTPTIDPAGALEGRADSGNSSVDRFFEEGPLAARMAGLSLFTLHGVGVFEELNDLGLVGQAFLAFYRATCFESDDPILELYRLFDTGEMRALAPQYIDRSKSK